MPLENTTTIDGLNPSWPLETESVGVGNDHIQQTKTVLKTMIPGSTGNGLSVPITATEAEFNKLVGLLSTTAELNKLNGATVTTAELNKLSGLNATTAELNYNSGVTLGTVQASKTVTADANGDVNFPALNIISTPSAVNGVSITDATTGNPARIQGTGEAAGAGLIIEATGTNGSVDINAVGTEYVKADGGPSGVVQGIYSGLDAPELLLNTTTPSTIAASISSATLDNAGAKIARVRLHNINTAPNDVGIGIDNTITSGFPDIMSTSTGTEIAIFDVNLDLNNDFWYISGIGTVTLFRFYLLGYYV